MPILVNKMCLRLSYGTEVSKKRMVCNHIINHLQHPKQGEHVPTTCREWSLTCTNSWAICGNHLRKCYQAQKKPLPGTVLPKYQQNCSAWECPGCFLIYKYSHSKLTCILVVLWGLKETSTGV